MTITAVTAAEAQLLIQNGAKLVDIRDPDEHAREHIPGAVNVPLGGISQFDVGKGVLVFHCRSGARTGANAARLAASVGGPCYVLKGGIDAWRRAGLEVASDPRQPLELMRQVQLVAGGLILLGVALGLGHWATSASLRSALLLKAGNPPGRSTLLKVPPDRPRETASIFAADMCVRCVSLLRPLCGASRPSNAVIWAMAQR